MIRREPLNTFFDRASVSEGFRQFVADFGAIGSPLDCDAPGLVILSNGDDAAGAFKLIGAGGWQMWLEFDPSCADTAMIRATRDMFDWMFAQASARFLLGVSRLGDERAADFNRSIGAHSVWRGDGQEVFEIARSVH